ncbi:MAG: hypothetical protein OQJ96_06040 [Flavobacteriales bacterium]|nr:hypothetical protein [Flavobacteriales bacterium]
MMNKLTYKKKLQYVLIISGVFMVVLYQLALSDTIDLAIETGVMEEQVANNKNAPEEIAMIKQKLAKIEQLIGTQVAHDLDVHQLLLESVTGYVQTNNLVLKDFPQPFSISDKGYTTKTALVIVEGDFIQLLKLSNYIENNYQGGKLVALDFKINNELRTRTRKLNSTIYLQNVKAENHEENS